MVEISYKYVKKILRVISTFIVIIIILGIFLMFYLNSLQLSIFNGTSSLKNMKSINRVPDFTKSHKYFTKSNCFLPGMNWIKSTDKSKCICHSEFIGLDCGIPKIIHTQFPNINFKLREKPKRILYAVKLDEDLKLFEIRIRSLYQIVDLFIIGGGTIDSDQYWKDPKWLEEFRDKFIYVPFSDSQSSFSIPGLKQVSDIRPSDWFLYSDTKSIPNLSILMFLKLYDGFKSNIFKLQMNPYLGNYNTKIIKNFTSNVDSNAVDVILISIQIFGDKFRYDSNILVNNLTSFLGSNHTIKDSGWKSIAQNVKSTTSIVKIF